MARAVYVSAFEFGLNVSAAVGRASGEAGSLPPIDVDEPEFVEQAEAELFELRLVEGVEIERLHASSVRPAAGRLHGFGRSDQRVSAGTLFDMTNDPTA